MLATIQRHQNLPCLRHDLFTGKTIQSKQSFSQTFTECKKISCTSLPLIKYYRILQQDFTIVNTTRILIGCRFFDQSTLLIYFSANVHCVLLVVDNREVEFRKYYARTLMNSRIIDS